MRCWPCVRGADPSCAGWVPLRVHAPLSRLPGRVRGRGIVPASVRAACNGQGGYEAVAWFPRRYGPHAMVRAGTRPWRDRAACADCLELRCVIRAACEDCSGLQCEYEAVTAMRVPRGACASSRFSPHAGRLTRALARSPADQPPDAHVNPLGRAWAGSPTLDPEGSRSTQKAQSPSSGFTLHSEITSCHDPGHGLVGGCTGRRRFRAGHTPTRIGCAYVDRLCVRG